MQCQIVVCPVEAPPNKIMLLFCCCCWCHPWKWQPNPSAAPMLSCPIGLGHCRTRGPESLSSAGLDNSGVGGRWMLPPPSSAADLPPPPLEVLLPHSPPGSTRCPVVGDRAPGVITPRSLCARPRWLSDAGDARWNRWLVGRSFGRNTPAGGEGRSMALDGWAAGEDGDRDRGGGGRVVGRRIHPRVGCSRGGVELARVWGRFVGKDVGPGLFL